MLTIEELDAFQQIKLDEVDIDTLVDLNSVKIMIPLYHVRRE